MSSNHSASFRSELLTGVSGYFTSTKQSWRIIIAIGIQSITNIQ